MELLFGTIGEREEKNQIKDSPIERYGNMQFITN